MGCDGFAGDSGSPLIDRNVGKVVGILFTGGVPKTSSAQDPEQIKVIRQILRHLGLGPDPPEIHPAQSSVSQNDLFYDNAMDSYA